MLIFAGGHDRADWAPFVAVRPWLLLLLMMVLAGWRARARLGATLLGLATATLGATAWLASHGDAGLVDAARAGAAGVALVGLCEILIRLARWAGGGRWLAGALGAGLLLPGALAGYERAALDLAGPPPRAIRPEVMVLSGLPLLWSEGGVTATLAGGASPASVAELGRAYSLRPLATVQPDMLARGRLLLIAQPRIDAAGLVAIDAWVRSGGRALILSDPDPRWPSRLAPDDPARPPGSAPLAPLLAHWGLTLAPDRAMPLGMRTIRWAEQDFRIRPGAPGRLTAQDRACRVSGGGLIADCAIGAGRAVVLADSDWLIDDLWVGVGSHGTSRYRRTADNGPALIAVLDDLGGAADKQGAGAVLWMESPQAGWRGAAWAFAPCLLLLGGGLLIRRRAIHATVVTKSQQTYPQPANRHKGGTTADSRARDS
ncbi:hypothetical protein [Sphingomonas sp. KC8]|uniref:hypothetical protein n=1 Tax=Sphingomonas sp. KC8 TaxID=1030157 RepID=UPI0002488F10|nr:hypothetical protein [Sphingomonas sp. KC8]ARS27461.1 hypothetical protein KC8_09180 [Sphingomonas sp. KC8]